MLKSIQISQTQRVKAEESFCEWSELRPALFSDTYRIFLISCITVFSGGKLEVTEHHYLILRTANDNNLLQLYLLWNHVYIHLIYVLHYLKCAHSNVSGKAVVVLEVSICLYMRGRILKTPLNTTSQQLYWFVLDCTGVPNKVPFFPLCVFFLSFLIWRWSKTYLLNKYHLL